MDQAFNASDRIWISKSKFVGRKQIDFLKKWSKFVTPSTLDEETSNSGVENDSSQSTVEDDQPSCSHLSSSDESFTTAAAQEQHKSTKEKRVAALMKRFEKLGDSYFAVAKTIIKENRKRKCTSNDDDEDTADDDGDLDLQSQISNDDSDQGENLNTSFLWRCENGNQENLNGKVVNIYDPSMDDESDDDEDDTDIDELNDKNIDSDDMGEGLRDYVYGVPSGIFIENEEDIFQKTLNTSQATVAMNASDSGDEMEVVHDNLDSNTLAESDINKLLTSEYEDDLSPIEQTSNDGDSDFVPSESDNGSKNSNHDGQDARSQKNVRHNKEKSDPDYVPPDPVGPTPSAPHQGMNVEYFEDLRKKLWEEKDRKERKDVTRKSQIQKLLTMGDDEFNVMMSHTRFKFNEVKRMPFVDKSVVKNGLMPILAPPIPRSVLEASHALSIYVNFSSNPGEFQWKCKSVIEQIANGLDDDLYSRQIAEAKENWANSECREEFVNEGDLIFHVVFYHQSGSETANTTLKEPEMAVTVDILGSQTLKDLRSKFYCKNDHIMPEIEGNPLITGAPIVTPDACLHAMQENMDKPCGIFVGNTMYINQASRQTENYSKTLTTWSQVVGPSRQKPGPFATNSMENTRMIDLTFKHGFPYLFVHQGNCEHLMVIEKARIVHPKDYFLKASFPNIVKSNFRTMYCQVDNTRIARYAVRNTFWFPQDPMLLCPECLKLCFKRNERIENFQLYHFPQISSLF